MGGSSQDTATTSNAPWSGQQPHLLDINNQARAQYYSGGPQYYPKSTVAPFSPQTQQGFDLTTQRALNGGQYDNNYSDYLTDSLGQDQVDFGNANFASQIGAAAGISRGAENLSAGAKSAFGSLNDANQFAGYGQSHYLGQLSSGGDPTQQLVNTAGGDYLGSNPYLDQVFDTAASKVTDKFNNEVVPGINSSFGADGRSGSGLSALALGDAGERTRESLNDLAGSIYAPAYESERGRQINAAGTLGGLRNSAAGIGLDNARQTSQLGGDLFNQDRQRQLTGGASLSQLGLGSLGNLNDIYGAIDNSQFRAGSQVPGAQAADFSRIGALSGVGSQIEDQSQRLIDGRKNRYDFYQNSPYQNLDRYSNAVNRLPGGYGQQTSSQPGPSRGAGALGGAISGATVGSQISPGYGTAIGGILGAAGGYFTAQ